MNLDLKNKVVIVTGSAQGLGKGIIEEFLKEDAKVVITDVNNERIENTITLFQTKYEKEKIFSFCGDLTQTHDIQSCVKQTLHRFGRIDILIANLGSGRGAVHWDVSDEEWNKMLDINFTGARRITKEILPQMIEQQGGSILFISSIAGIEVIGAPIHYSVAKAAVVAYSKNLARKVAKENIRVNTICPGNIYFENGTWDIKMRENKENVLNMLDKTVPQNRFATPEDIANLVVFISSAKASFITGSCLVADGGQTVAI
jgi:3-oxoacyl-[acyl-carrier protein] reductase